MLRMTYRGTCFLGRTCPIRQTDPAHSFTVTGEELLDDLSVDDLHRDLPGACNLNPLTHPPTYASTLAGEKLLDDLTVDDLHRDLPGA